MKHPILAATAALLIFTSGAQAHTHLEKAMPADNAVLKTAPAEIMLHFSAATRLTALSIQKEGEQERQIVKILPTAATKTITIPIAPLAPGKYVVDWRVVGDDNHVMSGKLHFTVSKK